MSSVEDDGQDRSGGEGSFPTKSGVGPIEEIGTEIGPYKLLSVLGEGGFGIVYLAEQKHPIRRTVALKLIKPGMDSKQVIARFEQERQALAQLDHPNIAHVIDAGTTDKGLPYFVMEYADGVPVTDFCDDEKLKIERRLEIFADVCEAIQHAHQKGIIHRDIKPSNVLVALDDKKAVPKVIDFGVAKAISGPLTEKTLFTQKEQLIGTPAYMSPEQAKLTHQDIDTRTDIYSLGVLLYELLAGALPFEDETLRSVPFDERLRIIRSQDPPKPSARLSSLGEKAGQVAAFRRTDVKTLTKRLSRELEWIPLMAMRKERDRRYRTAAELASDIQDYLSGDPLLAGPESKVYRIKKFARKHTGSIVSAATVLLVVLAGSTVSTTMYFRVRAALERESDALVEMERAKNAEKNQRELAETRAEELRVSSYYDKIHLADKELAARDYYRASQLLNSCDDGLRGWEWRHLWHVCRSAGRTWPMCEAQMSTVLLSADGNRVVSCNTYGELVVRDTTNGLRLMSGVARSAAIAITADGAKVVSVSSGEMILWDVATKSCLKAFKVDSWFHRLALSPDGRRVMWDGKSQVMDLDTGAVLFSLGRDVVLRGEYSRDGKRILTLGRDNKGKYKVLKVWNAADGTLFRDLSRTEGDCPDLTSATFSPDGCLIAYSDRKSIGILDIAERETLWELPTVSPVRILAFDPNSNRVAGGDDTRMIRVWDLARNGEVPSEIWSIRGHGGRIESLAFTQDGRQIISADSWGIVGLWKFAEPDGAEPRIIGEERSIRSIAFSADRQRVVMVDDKNLHVQDIADGTIKSFGPHARSFAFTTILSLSPSRKYIVTCHGGTIRVLDSETGSEKWSSKEISTAAIAFSPDGRHFASASQFDGVITIRDVEQAGRKVAFSVREGPTSVRAVAFYPDGKRVLVAGDFYGNDGRHYTLVVWNLETQAEEWRSGGDMVVDSVVFDSTQDRIVSGNRAGMIGVWDAGSGRSLRRFRHGSAVHAVDVSADGRRIISSGEDQSIKLWHAETGAELLTLDVGADVHTVALSPDAKLILAGCGDGRVRIWGESSRGEVADVDYWGTQAQINYMRGEYDATISTLTKAIAAGLRSAGLYQMRGVAYGGRWDYKSAIADYSRSLALDAENLYCLRRRALAYVSLGQYRLAAADCDRVVELCPGNLYALEWRASVYFRAKQYDRAIADYSAIIETMEDDQVIPYLSERAEVYLARGDPNSAIADYSAIIETIEDDQVTLYLSKRAEVYLAKGDPNSAIADFSSVIELRPKNTYCLKWRGHIYCDTRQYNLAIADFERVLRIDPNELYSLGYLAWMRATLPSDKLRNGPKAVELATRACELTQWNNAGHIDTLAAAYAEAGCFDSAIEWQEKAIGLLTAEDPATDEADFKKRLELYKSGKPYREK